MHMHGRCERVGCRDRQPEAAVATTTERHGHPERRTSRVRRCPTASPPDAAPALLEEADADGALFGYTVAELIG